jgi:hypothetical protein
MTDKDRAICLVERAVKDLGGEDLLHDISNATWRRVVVARTVERFVRVYLDVYVTQGGSKEEKYFTNALAFCEIELLSLKGNQAEVTRRVRAKILAAVAELKTFIANYQAEAAPCSTASS